jgi:hypothetical protein
MISITIIGLKAGRRTQAIPVWRRTPAIAPQKDRTDPIRNLSDAFFRLRYSRGRGCAARAIQATAPELFRESFAFECLWDCEAEMRTFASGLVPIDEQSLLRLRGLASNPWEDPKVRESASKRGASG